MSDPTTATTRDKIISEARSLPELIEKAKVEDPVLASQLTAKAAVYSKTYYATFLAPLVAWAVVKWGLGWDETTQALVVFLIGTGTAWLMRTISNSPIGGFFKVKPP
jgi:hypothetical protein